tara:strand:- start:136 stop:2778 length:2643 start_codon:yes stop_codon:yes gene_type:complete
LKSSLYEKKEYLTGSYGLFNCFVILPLIFFLSCKKVEDAKEAIEIFNGKVDGGWSSWEVKNKCNRHTGKVIKARECNNPYPKNGGKACQGKSELTQTCKVRGGWSSWENTGVCNIETGKTLRVRHCNNPIPKNGGASCSGSRLNFDSCKVDGGWSPWEKVGGCKFKSRTIKLARYCNSPTPKNGGGECIGEATKFEPCLERSIQGGFEVYTKSHSQEKISLTGSSSEGVYFLKSKLGAFNKSINHGVIYGENYVGKKVSPSDLSDVIYIENLPENFKVKVDSLNFYHPPTGTVWEGEETIRIKVGLIDESKKNIIDRNEDIELKIVFAKRIFKNEIKDNHFVKVKIKFSDLIVDDPLRKYQWGNVNNGQCNFALKCSSNANDLNGIDIPLINSNEPIRVMISDTSVQGSHEDLVDNFDFENSYSLPEEFNKNSSRYLNSSHGTAVAGIIGATSNNGIGISGLASEKTNNGVLLIANKFLELYSYGEAEKIRNVTSKGVVDIFNFSWGYPSYRYFNSNFAVSVKQMDEYINGRNGKGVLYVKSSGNEGNSSKNKINYGNYYVGNSNMDRNMSEIYTITTGAFNSDGEKSSYSTPGSNLWISAPGGEDGYNYPAIMTTKIEGCSYLFGSQKNNFEKAGNLENEDCKYTSVMNGTSAAAPHVSAVIAIMLKANPNLTSRDIKHILAKTAKPSFMRPLKSDRLAKVEFEYNGDTILYDYGTQKNEAGFYFDNDFGFGKIDGGAAVKMALNYIPDSFGPLESFSTSRLINFPETGFKKFKGDGFKTEGEFDVKEDLFIENLQIYIELREHYGDFDLELCNENNLCSKLFNRTSGISGHSIREAHFSTNMFYGTRSSGKWKVVLRNYDHTKSASFHRASLKFKGHR